MVQNDNAGAHDRRGGSVGPVRLYEPKRWMSLAIVVLLLAMALVFGFLIESLRADQYTLEFVIGELPVSDTELAQNHQRLVRDCTLLALLGLAVAVLWLTWQYRAHFNLRALVSGTRFSPVLGVLSWLIPGVNLVMPALATRELWKAGNPNVDDWRKGWTSPLVWLWWALFVSAVAYGVFAMLPVLEGQVTATDLFVRDHRAVPAAALALLASVAGALLLGLLQWRIMLKEDRVLLGEWKGWSERGR